MDDTTAGARLRVAAEALAAATFGDFARAADGDLYDWHVVDGPTFDEVRRVVPLRRSGAPATARSTARVTFVARFERGTGTLIEHGVARILDYGVDHSANAATFGSERVLRLHARPLVDGDARAFTLLGEAHGFLYAQHRSTGDVYRRPLDADTGFQLYTIRSAWLLRGRQLVTLSPAIFPPTAAAPAETQALHEHPVVAPRPEIAPDSNQEPRPRLTP